LLVSRHANIAYDCVELFHEVVGAGMVPPDVRLEPRRLPETGLTRLTFETFHSSVNQLMPLHMGHMRESFAARSAHVRLFLSVNSDGQTYKFEERQGKMKLRGLGAHRPSA